MWRILFVDDDARILDGLSRMLRSVRGEWEMVFAACPQQALQHCAAATFDVVISDERMPGMEGHELLGEVLRLYPGTTRIILSGQCGRDAAIKCVGVAHQFLSKPCDPDLLKSTVRRICRMHACCFHRDVVSALSSIQRLPSHDLAYAALAAEVASPSVSIDRLAAIIARDRALGAKVMQLVSSGFFGSPQRVVNAEHAARLLGVETIKALWDASLVFASSKESALSDELLGVANHRAVRIAKAAEAIVKSMTDDPMMASDAHLAGMLHDIGSLASPELPGGPRAGAAANVDPSAEDQSRRPNASGYLAALWGFPEPVVQATAYYHTPSLSPVAAFSALTAVHVAHAIVTEGDEVSSDACAAVDMEYLTLAGCGDKLNEWMRLCVPHFLEGASL